MFYYKAKNYIRQSTSIRKKERTFSFNILNLTTREFTMKNESKRGLFSGKNIN